MEWKGQDLLGSRVTEYSGNPESGWGSLGGHHRSGAHSAPHQDTLAPSVLPVSCCDLLPWDRHWPRALGSWTQTELGLTR